MIIVLVSCIALMSVVSILLYVQIQENKETIRIMKTTDELNERRLRNMIDAINYNDKLLMDNNKYVMDVLESNDDFDMIVKDPTIDLDQAIESEPAQQDPFYQRMMKFYDALTFPSA
jgi:hypothetical protein